MSGIKESWLWLPSIWRNLAISCLLLAPVSLIFEWVSVRWVTPCLVLWGISVVVMLVVWVRSVNNTARRSLRKD